MLARCRLLHLLPSHGTRPAVSRILRVSFQTSHQPLLLLDYRFFVTKASARYLSSQSVSSDSILRSLWPDVDIPKVPFAEFVLGHFDEFKDLIAMSDFKTGRQYTFRQLTDYTMKVASALHKRGYRKGDVISTCTINIPEFPILLLAAASLGVIVSPTNPAYNADEVSYILKQNGARAIFTTSELLPLISMAISSFPCSIKEVYTFGLAEEGAESFQTLMEDDGKAFPENVDIDPVKDVLFLPFSSGTTGLCKGVMLSHYNIVSNLLQIRQLVEIVPGDNALGLLPFFHIYGLTVIQFATICRGAQVVTVPRFEPDVFLKALQQCKISVLHAVPPVVLFLAKDSRVSQFDLSAMKYLICGAAPLGVELTLECQNRLGFPVYQGYGLTETSPTLNVDSRSGHPGTIGYLLPNTKAKMVDVETGLPVKAGQLGEYCVDGPQKMLGYLNNPQATKEMIDEDGWLHTGDLGYVREDGMVVIEDRLKELIKYKGFQVPPAELEGLLLTHPAIKDAGVVGVPDAQSGELPRAYVVLKPNMTASAEDICKFIEGKVSSPKKLRGGVEFLDEIPKTASGKILRRVLKAKMQTSPC